MDCTWSCIESITSIETCYYAQNMILNAIFITYILILGALKYKETGNYLLLKLKNIIINYQELVLATFMIIFIKVSHQYIQMKRKINIT